MTLFSINSAVFFIPILANTPGGIPLIRNPRPIFSSVAAIIPPPLDNALRSLLDKSSMSARLAFISFDIMSGVIVPPDAIDLSIAGTEAPTFAVTKLKASPTPLTSLVPMTLWESCTFCLSATSCSKAASCSSVFACLGNPPDRTLNKVSSPASIGFSSTNSRWLKSPMALFNWRVFSPAATAGRKSLITS